MSFKAMAWAADTKPKTLVQKFLLLMLANVADADGHCWPSYQYLADMCLCTRRCVIQNMQALEDQGFIRRHTRTKSDGSQGSNAIILLTKGSEPNSPGVVNDIPEVVNDIHQGSEPNSLGGSEPNSPNTITSFDTITDTVQGHLSSVLSLEMTKAVIEHRRAIKHPLSAFAAKLLAKELAKTRDPNHAAMTMIKKSWRGFEVSWYHNIQHTQGEHNDGPPKREQDLHAILRGECHRS
jgi:hypothetical protein